MSSPPTFILLRKLSRSLVEPLLPVRKFLQSFVIYFRNIHETRFLSQEKMLVFARSELRHLCRATNMRDSSEAALFQIDPRPEDCFAIFGWPVDKLADEFLDFLLASFEREIVDYSLAGISPKRFSDTSVL